MSKFTTRKSVAVVSALALGIAGLSGPAAFAVGTIDGKVTLAPSSGTTYGMITGQAFDLATNFATAADNGAKLKFLVTDASSLSNYDIDGGSITDFDTIAADTAAGNVFALQQVQGATDTVVAAFGAASAIEVGDVVDGEAIAVTGGTAAVLTALNLKTTVSAVKEVASGDMTSVVMTAGAGIGDADTIVVTKNGHGIVAGDIVELTSSGLPSLTTDTAGTVAGQLDGYHIITANNANISRSQLSQLG